MPKYNRLKSQLARSEWFYSCRRGTFITIFLVQLEDRQRSAVASSPQNIQKRDTVHQQRQEDLETSTISQLKRNLI